MKLKNYYQILNIPSTSHLFDIKKAYRALALKYHPDRNKAVDAEQKFIEITEAYEVLRDSVKRKEYDILYNILFGSQTDSESKNQQTESSTSKQQNWSQYGQAKAKEYASIPFDEFARRMLKEINTGAGYIPNLIAFLITLAIGISLISLIPEMFDKAGVGGLVFLTFIAGIFFAAYKLFEVAKSDYLQDRQRNNL